MVFALELVRRCPEVSFVLDHIGKPGIKQRPARALVAARSASSPQLPNVVVKVSGVITEADHAAWKPDDVKPYVAHVIDCFGFDRVHVRLATGRCPS